jgi:hypothetical protein
MASCLDSKELNPEVMESEVEHRVFPLEAAAVKSSGSMKKRHRGRHLAEADEEIQGNWPEEFVDTGGSWLPIAGRCPAVQKWQGPRGTSTGISGPGPRMCEGSGSTDSQGESADKPWRQKGSERPRRGTAGISVETRPEETTMGKHGKY